MVSGHFIQFAVDSTRYCLAWS